MAAFHTDPVAYHLPGGEDPSTAAARAVACFSDIAQTYPGGRVLVVMHSTLIRLVLCQLLGLPLAKYRREFPLVRNGALPEIRFDGDDVSLLEYNAPNESRIARVSA